MYGLIGQIVAVEGKRDELATLLAEIDDMPGCHHYLVGTDDDDPTAVWVTEIWESAEAHAASLELPEVQAAISRGREMIAGFGVRRELTPVPG